MDNHMNNQDYFSGINYSANGRGLPFEMYSGYNQQQYTFQTEAPPYTACPIPYQGAGKGNEWAEPGCGQHLEKTEPPRQSPLTLEQPQNACLGHHLDSSRLSHYEEPLDEQTARYVPDVGSARKECTPSTKKDSGTIFKYTDTYQSRTPAPVYIPSREVIPGDYGFKVTFKSPQSAAYTYSDASKTLCINKDVEVAAMFTFEAPPKHDLSIRTLVCCKNDVDILKLGPVKRCPLHVDKDKGKAYDHFLVCKNQHTLYGEDHSHRITTTPLNSLAECDNSLMCVYSLACYSTCIVGKGANKPTLVIVFSLTNGGTVVGQDVINLRCCACPNRDSGKLNKAAGGKVTKKQKKKKSRCSTPMAASPRTVATAGSAMASPSHLLPVPDVLNLVKDAQPDEEGYYNFMWRTRDVSLYNWLLVLKEGLSRKEKTAAEGSSHDT